MKTCRQIFARLAATGILLCLSAACVAQAPPDTGQKQPAQPQGGTPIVLDRVVAIVNGEVLLQSDVREEVRQAALQPISVPAGENTEAHAAQRLIRRSLILKQMHEQQQINYSVSDSDVNAALKELRRDLPACRKMNCETDEGWKAYLKANGLTEEEVFDHWKQRMEILKFINLRFGAGIRVSRQSVQKYYQDTVVPAFAKEHQKAPTLESTNDRIHEILIQQQVNAMLRDWLQSLRDQGSVEILDPAYGQSSNTDDDSGGGA